MIARPIRLLIVDDSAIVRKILTEGLARYPEIEVVGTAIDPYAAREKILELNPDVITLDIEMPRMDGLTFLKLIMKHRPMPVIIMSSLTSTGSEKALEALQAGAIEVLDKPSGSFSVHSDMTRLVNKIKAAAIARLGRSFASSAAVPSTLIAQNVILTNTRLYPARSVILLGASTGGTEALRDVLMALPADLPGICVVQHIPAKFSLAFANRLNELCQLEVREARHGDRVRPGLVLVAPGDFHLLLRWVGSHYLVELNQGPPVHHQRPAVDVLLDSAVKANAGPHALAGILTGMGSDGAAGLLKLRQAGAQTFAQNEESCVVFGMPREAIQAGAAQEVLPLDKVAARIDRFATQVALRAGHSPVAA